MFFAKISFYKLYENQPKHLHAIERKIKKDAMCWKNTQCNCANEMQCV
jgi:hypothetical protein